MKKTTSGEADKKRLLVLFSLFIVAAVGLAVVLTSSSSSTFSVSPFLRTFVGGETGSTARVVITEYPSSVTFEKLVTIKGTGFTKNDNRVHIGNKQINNLKSYENGTIILFEVPSKKDISTGTYDLFVRNSRGTSNKVSITVTNSKTPVITAVTPTSGQFGSTITITGTGFAPNANDILFGPDVITRNLASSEDGTKITYKVSQLVKNCPAGTGLGCGITFPKTYAVSVKTSHGTSNPITFTVTK